MSMHLRVYKSSWDSAGVLCKVKAVRKFAVSLFLPPGNSHGHVPFPGGCWDMPCVVPVCNETVWTKGIHFPEPEPQPCFLCKYKCIWGGKAVTGHKLRQFFTHRRDEQSPKNPNNMLRVMLTSQKGLYPYF